jgi:hypothetical protein
MAMPLRARRAAAPSNVPPPRPSYAGDFPDPAVVWDPGTRRYWAFATQHAATNVQTISSTDLATWSPVTDALPALPRWAAPGHTWAPSVARFGATWVMWYTTRQASSGRQTISVATASSPGGPYADDSAAPAVCQLANGGSIDAKVFVDGPHAYLLWKSDDNAVGKPTHLWGAALDASGTAVGGPATLLLSQHARWQATCRGPLGPCRDRATDGPWLGAHGRALGPASPDVFTDASGALRLAFHAWDGCVGYPRGKRALWVGHLSFSPAGPRLTG